MHFETLIAWGPFASPWMLAWGLSAAIPILIHLWNRKQRQQRPWAAMQFLAAAIRKRARRVWLERWTLLLLRAAILLLLAVALADPVWNLMADPASARSERTHTLLLIDASYSMAGRSGSETCFDDAREQAIRLVRRAQQGDGFTIVLLADPPRLVIQDAVFDANDLIAEIESLRVTDTVGDLTATLSEIDNVLAQVAERHPEIVKHQVCMLTDLRVGTWGELDSPGVRGQLRSLARRAELGVILTRPEETANLAIAALISQTPWPLVGETTQLEVRLRNSSAQALGGRLELLVDGRRVSSSDVHVPAGQEVSIPQRYDFQTTGEHVVEARLSGDGLNIDNHRWLSLPIRQTLRVLCVEGRAGAADFVSLALSLAGDRAAAVRPTIVNELSLLSADLSAYDCLVLCNVAATQPAENRLLGQFVRDGGGIVALLGDRAEPGRYNWAAARGAPDDWWLPAELGQVRNESQLGFDPLGHQHPIAAPFAGHETAGLLTVPIWKYFQLQADPERSRIAMRFPNGSPAVVTAAVGHGRSVLIATSGNGGGSLSDEEPWSALPLWPSFPPLMREAVNFAVGGQLQRRNLQVGELLASGIPAGSAPRRMMLKDPAGQTHRLAINFAATPPRWAFDQTYQSGVYEVASEGTGEAVRRFAVNVDVRESDLRQILPAELPAPLALFDNHGDRSESGDGGIPLQLFRFVLLGLFAMMLGESMLARWLGQGGDG